MARVTGEVRLPESWSGDEIVHAVGDIMISPI